ncbi:hypothetical protein IF1G_04203 [Cordyceps javanica]|uniref:Uncharacterized protein n=1 Tax=Cordyceps javanica TaxID=43265 RepID=A0A545V5H6_9HYPO|nr:hypothetical protein IF1G_04203 [Cordyceps javanica]
MGGGGAALLGFGELKSPSTWLVGVPRYSRKLTGESLVLFPGSFALAAWAWPCSAEAPFTTPRASSGFRTGTPEENKMHGRVLLGRPPSSVALARFPCDWCALHYECTLTNSR